MNSPRFIRFTPAFQPGDVFVRADAVTYVDKFHPSNAGLMGIPKEANDATVIGTGGYGISYVKESPSQVIEALRATGSTGDVSIEIVMPDDEPVGLRALIDDINNLQEIALLMEQRDEALADAKIADERAEWYKRRAETGDTLLKQGLVEFDKLKADRDKAKEEANELRGLYAAMCGSRDLYMKQFDDARRERDQLLAKLKDTTAALDKANCELNAARYDKFWRGDGYGENGFIGYVTSIPKHD